MYLHATLKFNLNHKINSRVQIKTINQLECKINAKEICHKGWTRQSSVIGYLYWYN